MKAAGTVLVVVGILLILVQIVMSFTSYHLTRPHDMHRFMLWMAVGLVVAIIGGVLARRADQ